MRRQPEGRAVHHRDTGLLQQIADEILVVRDRLAGRGSLADDAGAGRVDIERALGPRAKQAGHPVQHIDDEVAPLLEAAVVDRDEILRPGQRLDRRRLADRARVGGRVRLDRAHRLDQRLRAAAIADPPAGHAIGLRDAVDRQGALVEPRLDLGDRRELEIVIDEVLVHVVGHHPDMRMAQQHLGEPSQFRLGVGGAARVGRRVQDQPFGPRRDRRVEILGPQS